MTIRAQMQWTLTLGFLFACAAIAAAVAGYAAWQGDRRLAGDAGLVAIVAGVVFGVGLWGYRQHGTRVTCPRCLQAQPARFMVETEVGEACEFCADAVAVSAFKGAA